MQPLQITTNGTGALSTGTSSAVAIPNDSTGSRARTLLVSVEGATYILPGASTVTATTASPVVEAGEPLLVNVTGLTHVAILELTVGQRVTLTPVEE